MGTFVLTLVVAVIVNLITGLINRKSGLILLPWFVLYAVIYGCFLLFDIKSVHDIGMTAARQFPQWWSYPVVVLIFAVCGGAVWHGLLKGTRALDSLTAQKSPDGGVTTARNLADIPEIVPVINAQLFIDSIEKKNLELHAELKNERRSVTNLRYGF